MALRHLLLFCTMTALALSGCAGSAEPLEDADATAAPPTPAAARTAPAGAAGDAAAPLQSEPFSKDGTTWVGSCAYAVASACTPTPGDHALELQGDGDFQTLTGTLTWTPQADYTLRLFLGIRDGDRWEFSQQRVVEDNDGSIEFAWDIAGHETDHVFLAANAFLYQGAMGVGGGASVPFDFHLEGVAESLASP